MGKGLLFEIGCEEIPARFLLPALRDLEKKAGQALDKARLARGKIETFGTPRRLTLAVYDLAEFQQAAQEKRLGPPVNQAFDDKGNPTPAGLGFARSCGVSVEELGREQTPKGERLAFVREIPGRPAKEVLCELLPELVKSLEFPKSMRWGRGGLSFVRPIRWLVALFGEEPLEFSLDGLAAGATTRGHRFANPETAAVKSIPDYLEMLEKMKVAADPGFRRELIEKQVEKKAEELGGELIHDPELLNEVADLVEWPVVIAGRFHERFLALPREVLTTAMRAHQRYFALQEKGGGKLLPFFIAVADSPFADLEVVAKGNERVLAARLADAEFYWEEDLKTGIEKMRQATAGMVFYKTLGDYLEKSARVEKLCAYLCEVLFPGDEELKKIAQEAARYCKADLVSRMVSEFPELQGVMGGEYAKRGGLSEEVASAISDHYLPRSAEDIAEGRFPRTPAGDILSLADKADSLAAFWAAGLAPTGAGDPFALRRSAQALLSIALARQYHFDLLELMKKAAGLSAGMVSADPDQVAREVTDFILTRVKVQLVEAGHPHDVVEAGIAAWNRDLVDTVEKIKALARMKKRPDFEPLMIAFKRVMNIVEGEPGAVNPDLFEEESEAVLYSEYTRVKEKIKPFLEAREYGKALELMAGLKPAVDRFFDEVMVNVEDERIRRNRHALCAEVAGLFKQIADFKKVVIEGENRKSADSADKGGES